MATIFQRLTNGNLRPMKCYCASTGELIADGMSGRNCRKAQRTCGKQSGAYSVGKVSGGKVGGGIISLLRRR